MKEAYPLFFSPASMCMEAWCPQVSTAPEQCCCTSEEPPAFQVVLGHLKTVDGESM